jgi:hypothetical protein
MYAMCNRYRIDVFMYEPLSRTKMLIKLKIDDSSLYFVHKALGFLSFNRYALKVDKIIQESSQSYVTYNLLFSDY